MKYLVFLALISIGSFMNAQNAEKAEVKKTIEGFFKAFHQQDSVKLKAFAVPETVMQSIGMDKNGQAVLSSSEYSQFLKSIVSIPADKKFEEKIFGYTIQVDGLMANVWTPYEFWYDGQLSHCGVNSFQLMKVDSKWKILYIIDTRRKECDF